MRILIDIDDTLTDTTAAWQALIEKATGRRPDSEEISGSGWWARFGLDRPALDRLIDREYHSEAAINANVALPGAAVTIAGWRAAGHRVIIASDRQLARWAATAAWLTREGIEFDGLVLRRHLDKVELAQRAEIALAIDDRVENLRHFAAKLPSLRLAALLTRENRSRLVEIPNLLVAPDWPSLASWLAPWLAEAGRSSWAGTAPG